MKRTSVAAFALGLGMISVALGGAAVAKDGYGPRGDMGRPDMNFAAADTNGDGVLTKEELQAQFTARFGAADKDGDGKLTAPELQAHMDAQEAPRKAERAQMALTKMDKNGDGAVTADEMPAPDFDKLLSRLDANDDGQVTLEELDAMKAKFEKRKMRFGKDGHGKDGHGKGRMGF